MANEKENPRKKRSSEQVIPAATADVTPGAQDIPMQDVKDKKVDRDEQPGTDTEEPCVSLSGENKELCTPKRKARCIKVIVMAAFAAFAAVVLLKFKSNKHGCCKK